MNWKCRERCGECCGPVPIPLKTFLTNGDKHQRECTGTIEWNAGRDIVPETNDGLCLFLTEEKTCAIYDERPEICRRYGIDPRIPCPYVKQNGNPRSPAKVKHWQRKIDHDVDYGIRKMERQIYTKRRKI